MQRVRLIGGSAVLIAAALFGLWRWSGQREIQQRRATQKTTAPAAKMESVENAALVSPDKVADQARAKQEANDGFANEMEQLLRGPTQNSIPKIVQVASRWAAVDPEAAFRFLEEMPGSASRRRAPKRAVIEIWLRGDPEVAVAFAKAAIWRNLRNTEVLDLVFRSLVRTENPDPYAGVRTFLRELPQQEPVFREVFTTLMGVMGQNLAAAEALITDLPSGPSRDMSFNVLGAAKARAMGFAAIEALTGQPTLNADARRQLSGAATVLAQQSSAEFMRWLETQPVEATFDYARLRRAVDVHQTDTEKALHLAGQLSTEKDRRFYAGLFLGYWLKKDFAAAEAWAIASDLPAEVVAAELAKLTKVAKDYRTKLDVTLEIADERLRHRAQYQVQDWLRQDRAEALGWIKTNTKTEADQQFFARMIRGVPENAPLPPAIILD